MKIFKITESKKMLLSIFVCILLAYFKCYILSDMYNTFVAPEFALKTISTKTLFMIALIYTMIVHNQDKTVKRSAYELFKLQISKTIAFVVIYAITYVLRFV